MTNIVNNSGMQLEAINKLEVIGVCRNNWRQRTVFVYAIPNNEQEVISRGESFDGKQVFYCREPRNGFCNAIAVYPKTYVYN